MDCFLSYKLKRQKSFFICCGCCCYLFNLVIPGSTVVENSTLHTKVEDVNPATSNDKETIVEALLLSLPIVPAEVIVVVCGVVICCGWGNYLNLTFCCYFCSKSGGSRSSSSSSCCCLHCCLLILIQLLFGLFSILQNKNAKKFFYLLLLLLLLLFV